MSGIGIKTEYDGRDARRYLGGILKRLDNPTAAMKIIGAIGRTSIVRNFEKGGRPKKWKPLAKATLRKKRGAGILRQQGLAGGLMGSVSYKAFSNKAVLYSNKIYAAIHHFGGMAGRGRKVKIPARPYMMLQDEDWREMKAALREHILRGTI